MTEVISYKKQLENLVHMIRSPLVVLSLASEGIIALSKSKDITVSSDKMDEYTESLNLMQSSIKRLNDTVEKVQKNILEINQEEV